MGETMTCNLALGYGLGNAVGQQLRGLRKGFQGAGHQKLNRRFPPSSRKERWNLSALPRQGCVEGKKTEKTHKRLWLQRDTCGNHQCRLRC